MSDREEKKPRLEKMVDASEYKQKDTAINKLIKAFIPDNIYDLNTCALLGRIARTSDQLSDAENDAEIERAIDNIIKYDVEKIYKKVSH